MRITESQLRRIILQEIRAHGLVTPRMQNLAKDAMVAYSDSGEDAGQAAELILTGLQSARSAKSIRGFDLRAQAEGVIRIISGQDPEAAGDIFIALDGMMEEMGL